MFYIIDAFTDKIFGGNPAGVVLLKKSDSFYNKETMIKIAAELRYSETAFVKPMWENCFDIRYFTPTAEVDLCGHATIATFKALLDAGKAKDGVTYQIKTLAGNLEVIIENGLIMMDMAAPSDIAEIKEDIDLKELAEIMGIFPENIGINQRDNDEKIYYPMIISTGLPDIIMPVRAREDLDKIKPNFEALAELSKKFKVVGVHAFTLNADENEGIIAYCRNFAPLYGIDEEAATGTANGALTKYLHNFGLVDAGKINTFIQGETMGRPSSINSILTLDKYKKVHIKVGGHAAILAKGNLIL